MTQKLTAEILEEALELTAKKWGFSSGDVEIMDYSYGTGSWVKTDSLVEKLGWTNETQFKINEIHETAEYFAAGNYYNN